MLRADRVRRPKPLGIRYPNPPTMVLTVGGGFGALKRFAKALDHPAPWKDESLLRRPEKEDSPSRRRGHGQKRGGANLGGQPLFDQTLRRYAHQGRSLPPKKPPGLRPKIDEQGKRLLQADLKERPAATLPQRREFLQRMAGVRVSDSTISRAIKRLGWSRKKDRWVPPNATNGSGRPGE